jgi:chloride channel 3/4/5
MIAVMVAKWVGDAFGKEGIYSLWIAMRRYPWLPPVEYRDSGETASQLMKPAHNLVVVENGMTLEEMGMLPSFTMDDLSLNKFKGRLVMRWNYTGFPVVDKDKFIGYVVRDNLREYIGSRYLICSVTVNN